MEQDVRSFHYNYIKALSFYENKINQGRELTFRHHLLSPPPNSNDQIQVQFQQLQQGINLNQYITLTLTRVMHLSHCTYMLATFAKPFTLSSLVVVIVVMPQEEVSPMLDIRNFKLGKKAEIQIVSPFKYQQEGELLPTIVVPLSNIKPLSPCPEKLIITTEDIRQQANLKFKKKEFVKAIHLYEAALSNLTHFDQRKLSILYSNMAACLLELRLYESCIILSDIAINIDPTYNKAYYRKIRGLLELRRFSEVPPLMLAISDLIAKEELESLNEKLTYLLAQDAGVFSWQGLLNESCPQGEYFCQKLKVVDVDGQFRILVKEPISKFELMIVSRPLIYIQESGNNFKESFMSFLKQIENYYLYDQAFQQNIHLLPCKCHPCLPQRQDYYNEFKGQARPLPKKQLFNKMQRCVFEQKSIDKPIEDNGYGIWKQMFFFENKCNPNCSGIHLNGFWLVSAIKPIEAGSYLSIDLIAGVEGGKRKQTLSIKMQQECNCQICSEDDLSGWTFTTIQNLYDQIQVLQNAKKKKLHIWNIINREWDQHLTLYDDDFIHLIYYYIYYIEKQCQWDDFLNLLRLKEENDNEEINKNIDEVAVRLLTEFLKTNDKETEKIYQLIIDKVLCLLEE